MKSKTTTPSESGDLGTARLHARHHIGFDQADSGLTRARVKDQLFIDDLLMADVLTMEQHAAAERLLGLAQRAGVFLKPLNFDSRGGGGKADLYTSAFMRLRRVLKAIHRDYGTDGVEVFWVHIVEDVPTQSRDRLRLLQAILDPNKKTPPPG